ncbi:TPA: hypothetical protein L3936_005748 [Pseudomonas aeruginosa]|nr:hypothetical protein [Pseudomonas aeruginosa]HBN9905726.1 hypothetical protein [Pseudomonas aeruginosa]
MSNEDWNELDESYRSALSGALETAHPAVEQAGGDERAAFEAYRDRRNALLESEGCKPGSKWHITNAHYPTWKASRAALAQPSPMCATCNDRGHVCLDWEAGAWEKCPDCAQAGERSPMAVMAEALRDKARQEQQEYQDRRAQTEAERPEVAARVVHSNPVVLDHCAPLNANDEMMTVAQHAASVGRWAEMFNRVEQERDAANERADTLEHRMMGMMTRHFAEAWRNRDTQKALDGYLSAGIAQLEQERDAALAKIAELEANLGAALGLLRESRGFVDRDNPLNESGQIKLLEEIDAFLNSPVAQAQHSVPDGAADLCRFLAKLYCELDGLRYSTAKLPAEQIADALIFKWPVLQGARNQLNIKRISEQPYDESKLHSAIAAMLAAAPAQGGE